MKDYGKAILKWKELKQVKLGNIRVILKMGKDQEKDNSFGAMVNIIQESGKTAKNMVVVIGGHKKVKIIWGNGKKDKWLDMEYTQWKQDKSIKASLLIF